MSNQEGKSEITIVLVDDIPEARESIKKVLAFEQDFKVVGTASTGREAVEIAKEIRPDIMIMDINMPDMDGLEATNLITKLVPTCAVIMMSVQSDADYMRRAMLAGARDFLSKPPDMDELYSTIRTVYKNHEPIRRAEAERGTMPVDVERVTFDESDRERAGHIIAVYSPKGGVGTTTVATSLASGLMKEGIKVLLVDADLQFADAGFALSLQSQATIVDIAQDVDGIDPELFENIVVTHESGLKVLMGPTRPEFADEIRSIPNVVARILEQVAGNYDFIVVDTSSILDEIVLGIFDVATKIVLVSTPTLVSIKNVRFVLDLFDQMNYPPGKTLLTLNKTMDDRKGKTGTISVEKIQNYLKRQVSGAIPAVDERIILNAITKGVPVIAADRDQNKPPIKQLTDLSNEIYAQLMGSAEEVEEDEEEAKKRSGIAGLWGR